MVVNQNHAVLDALQTGAVELKEATGFENATKEQVIEHFKKVCARYLEVISTKETVINALEDKLVATVNELVALKNKEYTASDERLKDDIDELEEELAVIKQTIKDYAAVL